jgi:hypothetical protein
VTDFPHYRDEFVETILAGMTERYHELMAEAVQAMLGDVEHWKPRGILVPQGRDVVDAAAAPVELTWHGDAYVRVLAAARTIADPGTLEQRFAEALAQLEAPIDPRVWATTPEPCAPPPIEVEPMPVVPPVRWSRPVRMWP